MRIAFIHFDYYSGDNLNPTVRKLLARGHEAEVYVPGDNVLHDDAIETSDVQMAVDEYKPDIILCVGWYDPEGVMELAELNIPMSRLFLKDGNLPASSLFDFNFVENDQFVDELEIRSGILTV